MRDAKINVFTDEVEVKGTDLHNLFMRIEESRVAVAILSDRYTESSWCLDELAKMKEMIDHEKLVVIPIFYRLDANNCKRLVGAFGDNFRDRETEYRSEPERVQKWKDALISIPQKVGLTLAGHRDESELVDSIVKEVKKVLIDISKKERDNSKNPTNREGQSTKYRTQNNNVSSFGPLMAELDRQPPRPSPQVFLSFCKDEVGDNFVSHLVWALRDSGLNVFTESYKLREQEVFTSIELSNIALIIFSKKYSKSELCLNELVKIDKLANEGKLVVIPVFYNLKKNEVRRLEGEFGIHFADTKEKFAMEKLMIRSWEESLMSITIGRIGLSLETHINEFALVAAIVRGVTRLVPNSTRPRRRRKYGILEVFFRALTATFLFALFIYPMPMPDVNFYKIGKLLLGFPFFIVFLHQVLC